LVKKEQRAIKIQAFIQFMNFIFSSYQFESLSKDKEKDRVAILFTNSRHEVINLVKAGKTADTSLYGFNYIFGAEAFHMNTSTFFEKLIQTVIIIPKLARYKAVIAQDNFVLGYIISLCAIIFRTKTRWLYLAMTSSTLIRRYKNHPVRTFLFKKFWKSYARIVCLSSQQIEDLVKFGIPREKLVFIPFGVDVKFFEPVKASHENNLIVSIGRDAGRDYETLFLAAEQSAHQFIIVASKKNISLERKVPANVSVFYDKSLMEIRDLYAQARLVIVVSKNEKESVGSDCSGQTVILDALAAGRAVIATNRSWISDYFEPGKDLIVVDSNNSEALNREIEYLWNDVEKRNELGEVGRAKVSAYYTTFEFAQGLMNLIRSLD